MPGDWFQSLKTGNEAQAIARVAHEMFKDQFVCTSIRYQTWYEFRNHRWIENEQGIILKKKLSNEVLCQVLKEHNSMLYEYFKNDEISDTIISKLKDLPFNFSFDFSFREKVYVECCSLFLNKNFNARIDSDPNLIGFENGVYDLKKGMLRNGRPEDYITLSTGYDYSDYVENDEKVLIIKNLMNDLFPEPDMCEYMWRQLATFVFGQRHEVFHIWTGLDCDTKITLLNLLKHALGEYAKELPYECLLTSRYCWGINELSRLQGRRLICIRKPVPSINVGMMMELSGCHEPENEFDAGVLMDLVGGDSVTLRDYSFKLRCIPLILGQELPRIHSYHYSIWKRLKLVDFTGRSDGDNSECFIKSDDQDRLNEFRGAFIHILLKDYCPLLDLDHPHECPKKIRDDLDKYIESCDKAEYKRQHRRKVLKRYPDLKHDKEIFRTHTSPFYKMDTNAKTNAKTKAKARDITTCSDG